MIKVTFVITVLENIDNIEDCLNSILRQKNIEKEIVVIGNTKDELKQIEMYKDKSNIIYENNAKLTMGAMRNRGVELATGEYICFVDSKDFLDEDVLYKFIDKAVESDCEIIIGKSAMYNPGNNTYEFIKVNESLNKENYINSYSNPEVFEDLNIYNKVFKTKFIKENNIKFSDTLYYDYILFELCAFFKSKAIYVFPRVFYNERLKTGLEKVKNPILEERIDVTQVYDYMKVLEDTLEFQERNKISKNENIIINKYSEFILKRGLNYLNIEKKKDKLFEEISSTFESIDISKIKTNKKNKEILRIVKSGKINNYFTILNERELEKKKKNKFKDYIKHDSFKIIYKIVSKLKVKKNRILFLSHSAGMDGNYEFIYEGIKKYNSTVSLNKKFRCIFASTKTTLIGKMLMPIKLARAEYIILSENVPYFQHIHVRPETKVIQTWHAAGAFKKFGYSTSYMEGGPNPFTNKKMTMHNYYDYATVSSEEVRKHYAEAFNMDIEKVIPVGVPRADFFFNEKMIKDTKDKVYDLYPGLKNKKVILYAPTFRGHGKKRKNFNIEFDFNTIARNISNEYVIALKLHPSVEISNIRIDNDIKDKVINISEYSNANDILILTDLLITDYSSIIFDYSLLEKPMIFFAYDLDEYRYDRDFYYKYEEFVPGPIAKTNKEIINLINNWDFDLNKIDDFCKKFFVSKDGNNTDRFIKKILLNNNKVGK